jgi:hypothetical protein
MNVYPTGPAYAGPFLFNHKGIIQELNFNKNLHFFDLCHRFVMSNNKPTYPFPSKDCCKPFF